MRFVWQNMNIQGNKNQILPIIHFKHEHHVTFRFFILRNIKILLRRTTPNLLGMRPPIGKNMMDWDSMLELVYYLVQQHQSVTWLLLQRFFIS